MKYIIDTDALKNVLDVMHKPYSINGKVCVYLDDVKDLIDAFPKDKFKEET